MSIIFLVFGLAAIVMAFVIEGGSPLALLGLTPFMIVFGGVIGATGLTVPLDDLKAAIGAIPIALKGRKSDPVALINYLNEMSVKARKDGLLSLEAETQNESVDPFLRLGLSQLVDGVHSEEVRATLEFELNTMMERHATRSKVFESAGGYAPTMGIIGTVMGLVHILANLSDPDSLGPLIAAAFLATLYGISSANLLFLPLGGRLKAQNEEEVLEKSMIIEGIMSIQKGDSPVQMKRMLMSFLSAKQKAALDTKAE